MAILERSTPRYEGTWWKKLPQDQAIKVLVKGFVSEPPDTFTSIREKRVEALSRYSQAVKIIVNYILGNQESYPNLDESKMHRINALGILAVSLTPIQCSQLIESGLVDSIYPDEEIEIFLN